MVDLIPKPRTKLPPWLDILFYFSIGLLILVILLFFIFNHLQGKATSTVVALKKTLEETKTQERSNLEKGLFTYQIKIDDFSYLVQNHKLNSKLFGFLEGITHPQIFFSNMSFNAVEGKLILNGTTESFQTLGQQLLIFKNNPLIKETILAGVSFGKEGKIGFVFSLSLVDNILK